MTTAECLDVNNCLFANFRDLLILIYFMGFILFLGGLIEVIISNLTSLIKRLANVQVLQNNISIEFTANSIHQLIQ